MQQLLFLFMVLISGLISDHFSWKIKDYIGAEWAELNTFSHLIMGTIWLCIYIILSFFLEFGYFLGASLFVGVGPSVYGVIKVWIRCAHVKNGQ